MSAPRLASQGRAGTLEQQIMDRRDAGMSIDQIAAELDVSFQTARRIAGYMSESTSERRFKTTCRAACERYAAAIAATGRTFA